MAIGHALIGVGLTIVAQHGCINLRARSFAGLVEKADQFAVFGVMAIGYALIDVGLAIVTDHGRINLWASTFAGLGY